jgi:hypothetical protein
METQGFGNGEESLAWGVGLGIFWTLQSNGGLSDYKVQYLILVEIDDGSYLSLARTC